ncbi:hypothetical protein [Aquimarina algicola]|uniref:Uncharacterized protein n=1 Tax=Aquimarina algicola TaxID=2589995 RepID=A0A504JLQ3_9FLAO|nr:hypothetical protein [Aquimarina algicola]TPN87699.1 hypothetical protein FHK87_08975 [Aquimarina algicola]
MFKLKINYIFFLVICFMVSCDKNEAIIDTENIAEINEISNQETKILLDNGNSIRFQQIDDGELKGTFILEESTCEDCSVLNNITEMNGKELSTEEIFWALSKPGANVPEFLKTNLSKKSITKEQGWARETVLTFPNRIEITPIRAVVACKNSNFTSSIAGGFLGEPEFVALDKTPNNYNGFVNDCASLTPSACNKGPKYRLHAVMNNIKKWKGKICSRAIQNSSNDHYFPNSTTGSICQSPPCSSYVGPELYFEYLSNGKWKSMKNVEQGEFAGFEVPANTTKVYTYSWNTNVKTSFRLRVKNAMGKDQFDFMMDQEDVVVGGDNNGGSGGEISPEDFPKIPDHVNISGMNSYYLIVDFTNMIDSKPTITIPKSFLSYLPQYEDKIIFPNNFCGIEVRKAHRFAWFDNGGQVVFDHPYNSMEEDEYMSSAPGNPYHDDYLGGIRFAGPIGACSSSNKNWKFPSPLTATQTVMDQPLKLVIELNSDSEVRFFDYALQEGKPINYDKLFKEVDFNKMIKWFNQTFYYGFKWWVDAICEEDPSACPLED